MQQSLGMVAEQVQRQNVRMESDRQSIPSRMFGGCDQVLNRPDIQMRSMGKRNEERFPPPVMSGKLLQNVPDDQHPRMGNGLPGGGGLRIPMLSNSEINAPPFSIPQNLHPGRRSICIGWTSIGM